MRNYTQRLALMAAVSVGGLALFLVGFFVALAVRSALADPGGPVPNPGHAWTELQDHGVSGSDYWLGTTDNNALELWVNNARALRLEPNVDSPNVIGGYSGNAVTAGVYAAAIGGGGSSGSTNRVTDDYGSVGGGKGNRAGDDAGDTYDRPFATVGGGGGNTASGPSSTVGGGNTNTASNQSTTVGGGANNIASGDQATVGGGGSNNASGVSATVGGGDANTAGEGTNATVGGGHGNTASGNDATVGGGNSNGAVADHAAVCGGSDNIASAPDTTIGGGSGNRANQNWDTVGGGEGNTASGQRATIAGGRYNTASGDYYATVGGGYLNAASGGVATVGGGHGNTAGNSYATVGGGFGNAASGIFATVGGGDSNVAGHNATVGGGISNEASGEYATVPGGYNNAASGGYATVPGGENNTAAGNYSFAAGRQAKVAADHDGTFLFADQSNYNFDSAAANEFAVRATGGSRIVTGIDGSGVPDAGVKLDPDDNAWEVLSDRDAKENFVALDLQDMLDRLADVPITEWNYKTQDPSNRHIGPMAQDFYAAFGLSDDELYISPIDTDGVALAAIQGLYQMVQDLQAENASLQQQLDDLNSRVTALEAGAGTSAASAGPAFPGLSSWWLALLGGLVVVGLVLVQRRLAGGRR